MIISSFVGKSQRKQVLVTQLSFIEERGYTFIYYSWELCNQQYYFLY